MARYVRTRSSHNEYAVHALAPLVARRNGTVEVVFVGCRPRCRVAWVIVQQKKQQYGLQAGLSLSLSCQKVLLPLVGVLARDRSVAIFSLSARLP